MIRRPQPPVPRRARAGRRAAAFELDAAGGRRRRAAGIAAAALAALTLAACGGGGGASTRAATTTAAAQTANGPDPGAVAVSFTNALFGGRFDRARRYVAPASRNALLVVTAGLRGRSLSARGLSVGSTRVAGARAEAILTGTLCSSHSFKSVTRSRDCVTNRDPHSDNPIFHVALALGSGRRWEISYGQPSSGSGATAASRSG